MDDVAGSAEGLWQGAYKIPWDEPDFSARMLAEHLSQAHDLASRRTEWIQRQVAWLHHEALAGRPSRVLDLGCGPGLYAHRLAALGHQVHGIDFGPASVAHARSHDDTGRCDFTLGDLRTTEFGGPYDAAIFLYGELNVFPPSDALAILRRAGTSLAPG
ncbi:MAG: class I SAM-dependent methyltransferase, partial [Propionibacteriaceae bacterium]|nr:class I SAM-dependent methyltransferase [Propionibacteriaceae bacterium]